MLPFSPVITTTTYYIVIATLIVVTDTDCWCRLDTLYASLPSSSLLPAVFATPYLLSPAMSLAPQVEEEGHRRILLLRWSAVLSPPSSAASGWPLLRHTFTWHIRIDVIVATVIINRRALFSLLHLSVSLIFFTYCAHYAAATDGWLPLMLLRCWYAIVDTRH